jgi:hypothetical protein
MQEGDISLLKFRKDFALQNGKRNFGCRLRLQQLPQPLYFIMPQDVKSNGQHALTSENLRFWKREVVLIGVLGVVINSVALLLASSWKFLFTFTVIQIGIVAVVWSFCARSSRQARLYNQYGGSNKTPTAQSTHRERITPRTETA